jgi:hypothetical protein
MQIYAMGYPRWTFNTPFAPHPTTMKNGRSCGIILTMSPLGLTQMLHNAMFPGSLSNTFWQ